MKADDISFFPKQPFPLFILLTTNDNSCCRIEQVIGKD